MYFVFCHSCSCCEVTPSTIRQTSRRYAWWRRSSATWDTTSSRNRSLLWRPPYWWSPTRSVLCDTGRNFTNRFNTSLRSKRVLTACGVKVSFSLRCSKVTLQMLQYVRQKFFWLGFLVCGFTNFPLGHISVLCFYGNMLFGLVLAAGKFFSLHFDILSVRRHTLLDSDWLLDVWLCRAASRGQRLLTSSSSVQSSFFKLSL